jgi:predicted 3-demethylubiquinone-9 3-methyltransferase (glyoxalase superfamily)
VNQFVAENPIELYLEMFEDQHLQKSRYFYEQESGKIAATVAAPQFTRRIEQWLSAERMRCLRFCNSLSTERVMRCCEQELISRHLGLFKQEFTASLNEWRLEG